MPPANSCSSARVGGTAGCTAARDEGSRAPAPGASSRCSGDCRSVKSICSSTLFCTGTGGAASGAHRVSAADAASGRLSLIVSASENWSCPTMAGGGLLSGPKSGAVGLVAQASASTAPDVSAASTARIAKTGSGAAARVGAAADWGFSLASTSFALAIAACTVVSALAAEFDPALAPRASAGRSAISVVETVSKGARLIALAALAVTLGCASAKSVAHAAAMIPPPAACAGGNAALAPSISVSDGTWGCQEEPASADSDSPLSATSANREGCSRAVFRKLAWKSADGAGRCV
jgi:hypothetical protein